MCIRDRYYYVQSLQFMQGGPDADLGAVIFDVTGLPDGHKVKEVARIRYPDAPGGYHDFYVGYDPGTHQDKFYGAGLGGYSVWDVTHPESPSQLFTVTGLGFDIAHTFTPSPDGRYAVTETEYEYTPLRIWDLASAQHDSTQNLDLAISAWTADWRDLSHNHEAVSYTHLRAHETPEPL